MDHESMLLQLKERPRVNGYVSPKTETRPSPIQGLGLFATDDIQAGEVVALWGGRVTTKDEIEQLPKDISYNYALELYPGFYLAERAPHELDAADFINHSCEPNCDIVNHFVMVAKRAISPGEELTADFAGPVGQGDSFQCNCGAQHCKGVVYTG